MKVFSGCDDGEAWFGVSDEWDYLDADCEVGLGVDVEEDEVECFKFDDGLCDFVPNGLVVLLEFAGVFSVFPLFPSVHVVGLCLLGVVLVGAFDGGFL